MLAALLRRTMDLLLRKTRLVTHSERLRRQRAEEKSCARIDCIKYCERNSFLGSQSLCSLYSATCFRGTKVQISNELACQRRLASFNPVQVCRTTDAKQVKCVSLQQKHNINFTKEASGRI